MSSPGPPAKAVWPPGNSTHSLHRTRPAVLLEAFALAGPPAQMSTLPALRFCFIFTQKSPNRVSLAVPLTVLTLPLVFYFISHPLPYFLFLALTRI